MPADMRGIPLAPGDIILMHNIIMKLMEIQEGHILQIRGVSKGQANAQVTPGKLICQIEFAYDPTKPAIAGLFKLTQHEEIAQEKPAEA